jgi:hypothetical protein
MCSVVHWRRREGFGEVDDWPLGVRADDDYFASAYWGPEADGPARLGSL